MADLNAFKDGIEFPIKADLSGLKTGLGEAQGELKKTETGFAGFTSAIEKHGVAIGAAMTAAGGAIIMLTDAARETNADLMTTGVQLGKTTEEMRDLALETTNVTFPLEEVTSTFDLLTRAGMESTDEIQATATAFDTLGDATGNSASEVTSAMIPALNAFNIPLENAADHTDTLTYLMRNSTIELSEFSSVVAYLAPDLDVLGLSIEDTSAIMLAMADHGLQGSAATREFRTAVSAADGDVNTLYESLGITTDEVAGYSDEIAGASGITQDFADAQNTQFGTMDKLKQMYDEFALSAGSTLEPIEGLGAALVAGGPLLMGLTTMPGLIGGVNTAFTFLSANPIVLVVGGLILLFVLLQTKFDIIGKAADILGKGFEWLSDTVSDLIDWITEAVDWSDVLGTAFKILLGPIGWVMLAMDHFGVSWEDVWDGMLSIAQTVSDFITGIFDSIVGTVRSSINWVIDGINVMIRGLNRLSFDVPDWVPGIGGESIGFNLNTLPHFASGGIVTEPTLAVVGEAGPEAIVPLSGSNAGMGGVTITGNTFNVRNDQDVKKIATELYTIIDRKNGARGVR